MVAARHLAAQGARVTVLMLSDPSRIRTEEARVNYRIVEGMRYSITLLKALNRDEVDNLAHLFRGADVIVDAILGTGVRGRLAEHIEHAVMLANDSHALRIAVDIPTGIDPDTGLYEKHFIPHITVTFHSPKPALLNRTEKIVVANIGIPPEAEIIAGPGHVNALKRYCSVEKPPSVCYIHGEERAREDVVKLLRYLPCKESIVNSEALVSDPGVRGVVHRTEVVFMDDSVSISSVRPFLTRNQQVILTSPTPYEGRACYILRSEATHEVSPTSLKNLREKTRRLSESLKSPVYIVGYVDSLAYGDESLLNWMGNPLDDEKMPILYTVVAYLIALSNKPLLSIASASHILRTIDEPTLSDPEALANLLKEKLELA